MTLQNNGGDKVPIVHLLVPSKGSCTGVGLHSMKLLAQRHHGHPQIIQAVTKT